MSDFPLIDVQKIRAEKDQFFKSSKNSPLTREQKNSFFGLSYFPENPALRFITNLDEFDQPQEVEFITTTGDKRAYLRFASFTFQIAGKQARLTVYRSGEYFFLPFIDSQAGILTYPAGRYLDPQPVGDGQFLIDFNFAYNPYCAYNDDWSCPLTPLENHLPMPIDAGEKIYHQE